MHMRAAWPLAGVLLLTASVSGCLGVDNMEQFKAALGFEPEPLELLPPVARARASLTLASVGQVVAFHAHGSEDPQGLPLEFAWEFGDGTAARGAEATHRFASPGRFDVRLEAHSAAGLVGRDALQLTVLLDRAPTARLDVLRGDTPVERALAGEELRFVADARDPEGAPLRLAWDFGDGTGALTPEAMHAYARGGLHTITLRAEDPHGNVATATRTLPVDQEVAGRGRVAVAQDSFAHALPASAGAQRIVARVAFDPMLGLHGLAVAVVDGQGREVGRAVAQPAPGAQGLAEAVLELAHEALARHTPGDWSVVVQRVSGLQVDYTLNAVVRY